MRLVSRPTLTLLTLVSSLAFAEPVMFHVAVDGDDAAVGSAEAPFRTLTRARDAIRDLKREAGLPDGGVRVVVHDGIHRLAEPLALGYEDSGTEHAPIVYAAAEGKAPVISGGRAIAGLRPNADGSWSASIPQAANHGWVFRQLFVNGRRYIPARSPNEGQYSIMRGVPPEGGSGASKDRFVFRAGDIQVWPNLADIELRITFSWNTGTFPVKAVDPENRIVTLAGPAVWELPKPGLATCPYIVMNHPGACDAPGEWQLDRETGELRIIPFAGDDLGAAEVVAPMFECLVSARGDAEEERWVEHVRFDGLSFQHAGWDLPASGFSTPQAASGLGAALEFSAARHCAVTGCEVAHVGRYGISFDRDSSHNTVQRNHLHDLGGGGVRIGTTDRPRPVTRLAHHNLVDNNYIHDGGHTNPGAVGIFMGYGANNTFSHNEVCDLRYTGISLGWTWDIVYSGTRENIVEYNHVHHVMRTLEDGGGIYSLGLTPGSVIRNNLVHHIGTPPNPIGHGIYIDGGSSGLLCENNVCHDCGHGGIRIQHGTSCITVLNNISAFCGFGLGIDSERTNIFQYNIVALEGQGTPFRYVPQWQSYNKIIDYNLYWRPDGKPMKFLDFTWDEWREKEGIKDIWYTPRMDAHSRIADPKFVDAENRDFRLQPDSPALAMGFRPIDTSAVGLYGDAAWTSLPSKYTPKPLLPNERHLRSMLPEDDFDDGLPGQKPALAAVVEDVKGGAYVEISDLRALSAPHSLRFVDAPDLTYHLPHIYYSPHLSGDMLLRMDFDLYREPGAMLWTEWRNTASYAKVGPCLYIEKDGRLLLNEKRPTETILPDSEWLHFTITDGLGALADAKWDLTITGADGRVLFEGKELPCGPEFNKIEWLGFVSNGTQPAEMYLDNVVMRQVGP
ncbi:MAG: right-handed parallel beta-helix repeat-containing protein [Acidobacteriota bacterium]|nr:right-handed parallel beta-helix repeat-containing protein [Acidobacteriota bacterium]